MRMEENSVDSIAYEQEFLKELLHKSESYKLTQSVEELQKVSGSLDDIKISLIVLTIAAYLALFCYIIRICFFCCQRTAIDAKNSHPRIYEFKGMKKRRSRASIMRKASTPAWPIVKTQTLD
uniref:Uncharacterized protein n=1 Tax=Acrobeloides nanus TaxID=290746 RepID=A0A914E7P5_9BILA